MAAYHNKTNEIYTNVLSEWMRLFH